MKIVIGYLAIVLLLFITAGLTLLNLSQGASQFAITLLSWTSVVIAVGIWTRFKPEVGFKVLLAFYVASVIIKDAVVGGEYLLPFLFHVYFISSMIIAIKGAREITNEKRLTQASQNTGGSTRPQ